MLHSRKRIQVTEQQPEITGPDVNGQNGSEAGLGPVRGDVEVLDLGDLGPGITSRQYLFPVQMPIGPNDPSWDAIHRVAHATVPWGVAIVELRHHLEKVPGSLVSAEHIEPVPTHPYVKLPTAVLTLDPGVDGVAVVDPQI